MTPEPLVHAHIAVGEAGYFGAAKSRFDGLADFIGRGLGVRFWAISTMRGRGEFFRPEFLASEFLHWLFFRPRARIGPLLSRKISFAPLFASKILEKIFSSRCERQYWNIK